MKFAYTVTFRRRFSPFKKSIKNVIAHSYNADTDKMWLCFASGGREVRNWSNCEVSLGLDWKAHMEKLEADLLAQGSSLIQIVPK